MIPAPNFDQFLKVSEIGLAETLYMICSISRLGGRAPFESRHVPLFIALGESDLTAEKYESIQNRVRLHIRKLASKGLVKTEPELDCTLDPDQQLQLENYVKERSGRLLFQIGLVRFILVTILPEGYDAKMVMSHTDDSLRTLISDFGRELRGLFVKVVIGPMIFTALFQAGEIITIEDLRSYVDRKLANLVDLRIASVRMSPIPEERISLFPMTSALSRFDTDARKHSAQVYLANMPSSPEQILRMWYQDYLRYKRKILQRVRNLDAFAGGMLRSIRAVLVYNSAKGYLSINHYMSNEPDDSVEVQEGEPQPFNQPNSSLGVANRSLISDSRLWSKRREMYLDWDHPYVKALIDVKEEVRDLTLWMQWPLYDATIATEESLTAWAKSEVGELRLMSRELGIEDDLREWIGPVHVYIAFRINEPRTNRARDGIIMRRFYTSTSDLYQAKETHVVDKESGWITFEEAYPQHREENSSLLGYLGRIIGDPNYVN